MHHFVPLSDEVLRLPHLLAASCTDCASTFFLFSLIIFQMLSLSDLLTGDDEGGEGLQCSSLVDPVSPGDGPGPGVEAMEVSLELGSIIETASFVDGGMVTFPSMFMLEKLLVSSGVGSAKAN